MIVLASKSPRRSKLLSQIGLTFKVVASNINEGNIGTDSISREEFCKLAAIAKSQAVAKLFPKSIVIGADTIVINRDTVYGKPKSIDESKEMLKSLSGADHKVYTGVSINIFSKGVSSDFLEETTVSFRKIDNNEIDFYVKNYNVLDKAGGYGIQCYASRFVKSIKGCFYNVMGLPLSRLSVELDKLKAID